MRRTAIILTFIAFSSVLLSPTRAAGWTAESTKLDLTAGAGYAAAYLAPDGSHFAYNDGYKICIYTLAGEKGRCVSLARDSHIDLQSVRWSPDSTKLAFSEEAMSAFYDSDIWMVDTQLNTLTDLTPAPNREVSYILNRNPKGVFTVDIDPQWSADSHHIYFIRYQFQKTNDAIADFYQMELGSAPTEIGPVKTNFRFSTLDFALSPDESHIVYNKLTSSKEKDGTWALDLNTQETQFVAAPSANTIPRFYQFSADRSYILTVGDHTNIAWQYDQPETSPVYTVQMPDGHPQTLNDQLYVSTAGWGAQDSRLAYIAYNARPTTNDGLYITNSPGEAGELVLPGNFIAPVWVGEFPLTWAANNTILLSDAEDYHLIVVQLKTT